MDINNLIDNIISGYRINDIDELLAVVENTPRKDLYEACHRLTRTLHGDGFDTCTIINVKSGLCSEDCQWCAQSAHYSTGCDTYDILEPMKCTQQARHNESMGVKRFSLVASGRRPSLKETDRYVRIFKDIKANSGVACCASLGLATEETLRPLREAGVETYHCNMESAPSFFDKLCSTHTQADKEETLKAAKKVGMRVCSGGIIGMGEDRRQRAEFALYLASLDIRSIPLNILQPIPGTPLQDVPPLTPDEVLLAVCMFRLANPEAFIRFSGGRGQLDRETQKQALYIGVNAAITGDLLTTVASETKEDMALFKEMNYDTSAPTTWQ
ncbi:biotin synthase BioB [Porphyromonas sp.]|uniref:biotin synthase BioB n=1 Tax=Porphyromonas sp. TaxID=1924944 RepID=UPI0026DBD2DE|nr:biotin synthase BioB [Porphyromonas sp.]MDO4771587.1 biotin synthase BioB [Porphyromonas sp.]